MTEFSKAVICIISAIPEGRVETYGSIAVKAGNPRAARQVSRLLHSSSGKHGLPWHRVINSGGKISLTGSGADLQRQLLESEGIIFDKSGRVDLEIFCE